MSFKFDSTLSQYLNGTLGAAYSEPITLFAFVKHVNHTAILQTVLGLGETVSSPNSSLQMRYVGTTERYNGLVTDTAGVATAQTVDDTVQDNVWFGMVSTHPDEGNHTAYIRTIGTTETDVVTATTNAMGFVRVGRSMGGGNYYGAASPNESKMAEIGIVTGVAPTTQQITDYLAGVALSSLGFGANLKLYVPMSTNSLTNLGSDSLGSLTNTNGATYDSDHPIITTGQALMGQIWV